jgi:predicted NAD/FAD-dependent oxidoreductase
MTAATIAVVGAGLAGLTCARALTAAGYTVVVFEKARGPGGRMSTRRDDTDRAVTFDHGAQFFTARDPAFALEVERWRAARHVDAWGGRIVRWGTEAEPQVAPGARFVGVPTMNAPLKALAADLPVRYGVRVGAVRRVAGGWALDDDAGTSLGLYDRVALAVPGPQAVPLAAGSVAVRSAAESIAYAPCWAVMASFEAPLDAPFDAAFVEERGGSALGFVSRDTSKPARAPGERWVLHGGPGWSTSVLEARPEDVIDTLVGALGTVLGGARLSPSSAAAHRWRYALPIALHPESCAYDAEAGLGLCGDGCQSARVEGAWLSGRALAAAIETDLRRS